MVLNLTEILFLDLQTFLKQSLKIQFFVRQTIFAFYYFFNKYRLSTRLYTNENY